MVASVVAGGAWVGVREQVARPTATVLDLVVAALAFAVIYAVAWIVLPGGRRATREGVELAREIVPAGR